jgi:hypothetical protein
MVLTHLTDDLLVQVSRKFPYLASVDDDFRLMPVRPFTVPPPGGILTSWRKEP